MQVFKEIEVAELMAMLEEDGDKVHLIDIRGPVEIAKGIIPGSDTMPLHQLPMNMEKLRAKEIVVLYCQVGVRSAQACAYLTANGIENVHNLRGGIQAWVKSGLQVA